LSILGYKKERVARLAEYYGSEGVELEDELSDHESSDTGQSQISESQKLVAALTQAVGGLCQNKETATTQTNCQIGSLRDVVLGVLPFAFHIRNDVGSVHKCRNGFVRRPQQIERRGKIWKQMEPMSMLSLGRRGCLADASIVSNTTNGACGFQLTRTLLAMNIKTCIRLLEPLRDIPMLSNSHKDNRELDDSSQPSSKIKNEQKGVKCFTCNKYAHAAKQQRVQDVQEL